MSQAIDSIQGAVDQGSHDPHVAHHFESAEQQYDSAKLGMWVFLVTEILFFSGLFCVYAVYRSLHPEVFLYAHQWLDKGLGALNTVVLIVSSFTMAWAVRNAQLGQKKALILNLTFTLLCAATFMGIKAKEYSQKFEHGTTWGESFNPHEDAFGETHDGGEIRKEDMPRNTQMFFSIYFALTGLHGIHVLVGMGLIIWLLVRAAKGTFGPRYFTPVDTVGLYWHLVDLIWIFLFPLLYLIH
jgi:cytochrome c oxidase subunit 3